MFIYILSTTVQFSYKTTEGRRFQRKLVTVHRKNFSCGLWLTDQSSDCVSPTTPRQTLPPNQHSSLQVSYLRTFMSTSYIDTRNKQEKHSWNISRTTLFKRFPLLWFIIENDCVARRGGGLHSLTFSSFAA